MVKVKPIIKWSGSKRIQSEFIVGKFPKQIITYYEPFIGGGSVVFQLLHSDIEVNEYVCSDINKDLINLWNEIKDNPENLTQEYARMWKELNVDNDLERKKKYFNSVRESYNKNHSPTDFLFISRTCVNGKIRYNKRGEFNNTFHVTRNGITPDKMSSIIREWSNKLNESNVKFIHQSYDKVNTNEGDFIYLDPPYAGTTDMYYGGIETDKFYNWLRSQKANYILSYDGISGKDNYMTKIPNDLYDVHMFIENGNSTFKKVDKKKNETVKESLYIKSGDGTMFNFDSDLIKKDLSELLIGDVVASYKMNNTYITLEVNGDGIENWYEIVKYIDGVENSFSDALYEIGCAGDIEKELVSFLK